MQFKDYFSGHAANYASARPHYPPGLFEFLAQQCPQRELAWDCATGNGQAAVALASHFSRVIATDASAAQLGEATAHPRVAYQQAAAEKITLARESTDLVAVAQALHWLDTAQFFANVKTVLKPGGVLATWCYGMTTVSAAVDQVIYDLYENILGEYWPKERRLVERAYRDIEFPFAAVPSPAFRMQCEWSLPQLQDYLLSWSAARRFIDAKQANPLQLVHMALEGAWGGEAIRTVSWPLHLHVCRK